MESSGPYFATIRFGDAVPGAQADGIPDRAPIRRTGRAGETAAGACNAWPPAEAGIFSSAVTADMPVSSVPGKRALPRIAFLQTHPVQYVAPLYRFLNASGMMEITALYLSDYSLRGGADRGFARPVQWDIDLLAGYEARFIGGAERRGEVAGFLSIIAPQLWRDIRSGSFDAMIVHGHTPAAMILAAVAAKASRIPVLMRCETHLGLRRSVLKRLLRHQVIGSLYRQFDAVLAIGSANRDFYRAIGVPADRIFPMPYAVDNGRFVAGSLLSATERRDVRAALGVGDERPIVLYAAKFQPRKRSEDLLRAAALLNEAGAKFHLAMIGSGEREAQLRATARFLGLANVCFPGFVNQAALPRYYGACDIFVLPSSDEPWGLAINEAMCAALPIVAASEIGCVPDLVRDGVNGRIFPAGNIAALAEALRKLIADAGLRERMGQASRDMIARWSYAECAAGLSAALAALGIAVPVAMPGAVIGAGDGPVSGRAMTLLADAVENRAAGRMARRLAGDRRCLYRNAYRGESGARRGAARDRGYEVRHGRRDARQPADAGCAVACRRAPAGASRCVLGRIGRGLCGDETRAADRHRRGAADPLGIAPAAPDRHRLFQLRDRRSLERDDAGLLALAGPAGI